MNLTKNIELTNQKMCKIDLGNSDFIGTSVCGENIQWKIHYIPLLNIFLIYNFKKNGLYLAKSDQTQLLSRTFNEKLM